MIFTSLLTALYLFQTISCAAEYKEKTHFLKTKSETDIADIADASFVDCILNRSTDLTYYDFWGNEILWRPDRTLPIDCEACGSTGNTSLNFRKYAGLISDDSREYRVLQLWDFGRINELTYLYYEKSSTSMEWIYRFLPCLDMPETAESCTYVLDLLWFFLPKLWGSCLDSRSDVAGMLMFMIIRFTEDLEGYFDGVRELYADLKEFGNLILEGLESMVYVEVKRERLLEELFKVALDKELTYTLELFYALEIVEFDEHLVKYALKNCVCPVLLNRLFDFVDWKGLIHVPEIRISTPVSILHYLYEAYPAYLQMLFDYEESRVDWTIAEIPGEEESKTILGKILDTLIASNSVFEEDGDGNKNDYARWLLRRKFAKMEIPRLISRSPDRDLFDECLDNEQVGLKKLAEYLDALPFQSLNKIIGVYMWRIVELWWNDMDLPHAKVFKILLKRRNEKSEFILDILNDTYELIWSKTPGLMDTPKPSPRSARSSSVRRSSSGEFLWNMFRESPSPVNCEKAVPVQVQVPKLTLEMMKVIAQEGRLLATGADAVATWTARIADIEEKARE